MGSIFVSEKACAPLCAALRETGHDVYLVKGTDVVYDAISAHPDIYMCRIKNVLVIDDVTVTEPDLRQRYMDELETKAEDFREEPIIPALKTKDSDSYIVCEMGGIGCEYPYDAAYNAVSTDRFFIHNTELTSPLLLDRARSEGLNILSVKQGYTKCSCVVVGDNGIITADEGIYRTVCGWNRMIEEEETDGADADLIDALLIERGHVALEGFEYGFLGGASGCVDETIYFNGDLSAHPDFGKIREFIEERGYRVRYFEEEPLTDIGSIVFLP